MTFRGLAANLILTTHENTKRQDEKPLKLLNVVPGAEMLNVDLLDVGECVVMYPETYMSRSSAKYGARSKCGENGQSLSRICSASKSADKNNMSENSYRGEKPDTEQQIYGPKAIGDHSGKIMSNFEGMNMECFGRAEVVGCDETSPGTCMKVKCAIYGGKMRSGKNVKNVSENETLANFSLRNRPGTRKIIENEEGGKNSSSGRAETPTKVRTKGNSSKPSTKTKRTPISFKRKKITSNSKLDFKKKLEFFKKLTSNSGGNDQQFKIGPHINPSCTQTNLCIKAAGSTDHHICSSQPNGPPGTRIVQDQ